MKAADRLEVERIIRESGIGFGGAVALFISLSVIVFACFSLILDIREDILALQKEAGITCDHPQHNQDEEVE